MRGRISARSYNFFTFDTLTRGVIEYYKNHCSSYLWWHCFCPHKAQFEVHEGEVGGYVHDVHQTILRFKQSENVTETVAITTES